MNRIDILVIAATPGMVRPLLLTSIRVSRRQIHVPDVVMHGLEVPEILAGLGVQRHDRVAVEIVARTVAPQRSKEGAASGR